MQRRRDQRELQQFLVLNTPHGADMEAAFRAIRYWSTTFEITDEHIIAKFVGVPLCGGKRFADGFGWMEKQKWRYSSILSIFDR